MGTAEVGEIFLVDISKSNGDGLQSSTQVHDLG